MAEPAPDPRAALLREVQAAIRANDLKAATAKALVALDAGIEHPMLLNLRALKAEEEGRAADALPDLQRANVLQPNDFTIVNALGLCLARLERYPEAAACFDAAIKLEPRFAPAHHNKGWVSEVQGDLAAARAAHETALKMNPSFVEASSSLAMMAARAGDMERARRLAEGVLNKNRNQPTAQTALAAAEVADGQFAVAEARMRLLLAGDVRRILPQVLVTARGLWADALDGLDRPAEAFAAYAAEKAEVEGLHGARFKDAPGPLAAAGWLRDWFEAAEPWPEAPAAASPARRHVFVAGFPGSGGELIGKAFAEGGEATVLADPDLLGEAARLHMADPDGLRRLARAGADELEAARQAYWSAVRARGAGPEKRVVVDASPLNLLRLPLIDRLFPGALVLVARRDPRDVAVELMRRHYHRINAAGYELLVPGAAARLQDQALALTEAYAARLPGELILIRYEDLVEDAEAVAAGLGDRAGVRAAPAVVEPRQAPGQWRRYAPQLAPVLAVLGPWAERLGYPTD